MWLMCCSGGLVMSWNCHLKSLLCISFAWRVLKVVSWWTDVTLALGWNDKIMLYWKGMEMFKAYGLVQIWMSNVLDVGSGWYCLHKLMVLACCQYLTTVWLLGTVEHCEDFHMVICKCKYLWLLLTFSLLRPSAFWYTRFGDLKIMTFLCH